ncbi:MAG: insulinase family protein, partial [Candidatus Omnitrophica bacterium]|nr:insulinase family protein [Candidatus Omnitrophota bacterium]
NEEIYPEIEKVFSGVKRYFVNNEPDYTEPPQLSKRLEMENERIKLAHAALSYRSVSINDPSLYALDVLATILASGEGSILTKELRDNKKLAYFISCYNSTLRRNGLFFISFIAESGNVALAISEILKILEGIKKDGVARADLEKAKKMAAVDFLESLQTAQGRGMDLISSEALTNDYNFSQKYLERLNSVSTEDIKTAAGIYLDESKLNVALIMPEGFGSENETPVGGKMENNVRNITHQALPSGVRVIICEDHSLPICTISAMFLGGVRFESKDCNGISNLASRLMLDGTSERNEEEIKAAIESLGGSIHSISGMNSFGITLNFASSDWKNALEILSDVIKHPVFDEIKIDKEKALALAAIKERDDSIVEYGLLLFRENFFKDSPYSRPVLGHAETVEAINKDGILNYYDSFTQPSLMVITATGDIDKEAFIAEVKKEFGSAKQADTKLPDIPVSLNAKTRDDIKSSMEREQSIILIGFPAVKITDPDRYAFEVIDSIMSGSDGRLFNNVRSRLGVSYSLGSIFMPGVDPGCHIFYVITSAKNISVAKDAILKEIKRLKTESIPEKELDAAKRYLIAKNITDIEENASINLKMALDELYGLGYNNFETYKDKISAITPGQIKRVTNQYFNTDDRLIVTIYGKEGNGE